MSQGLLLIVGERLDGQLLEAVQRTGYAVVFMTNVGDALNQVRHGRFVAVVVDCRAQGMDVLELALNVRDFRSTIPLVVVGPCGGEDAARAMGRQPYTQFLKGDSTVQEWIAAMDALAPESGASPALRRAVRPDVE